MIDLQDQMLLRRAQQIKDERDMYRGLFNTLLCSVPDETARLMQSERDRILADNRLDNPARQLNDDLADPLPDEAVEVLS